MFDRRCESKVSRRFSWPLFSWLVFRLRVCECPSALSQNFRNLPELLSMQSAFETSQNFHHGSCSLVLGNEKVHVYQVPSQKTSPILREINSNFKELAIFPSRIKGIDSRNFSRIASAISEPKIGHVTVRRVCYC